MLLSMEAAGVRNSAVSGGCVESGADVASGSADVAPSSTQSEDSAFLSFAEACLRADVVADVADVADMTSDVTTAIVTDVAARPPDGGGAADVADGVISDVSAGVVADVAGAADVAAVGREPEVVRGMKAVAAADRRPKLPGRDRVPEGRDVESPAVLLESGTPNAEKGA